MWDGAWQSPGPHRPALPSPLWGTQPLPGLGAFEERRSRRLSYCCQPHQPLRDRSQPEQPAVDGSPGDSPVQPRLRPLPPAPCDGAILHLEVAPGPPAPFLLLLFPMPLAQAERRPDSWGP